MNHILAIGGTGRVGRHVVSSLVATGVRVRVLSRNPASTGFSEGAEVVGGDLTVPETLDDCLDDIDTVFLVWTAPRATTGPVIRRIANRARRIVFLSAPLKTPHPLFQQPSPARAMGEEIEHMIENSGLQWTFLRPGMFAANALNWWAPQISAGDVVRWPYLSVATAPIDERDIAAVAVRALCDREHLGSEHVLTGPESLTQFEQLRTIGRAIGRSLTVEEISPEAVRDGRVALPGVPARAASMLLDAWSAALGQPAFVSSDFEKITGSQPRTLFTWATDNAAAFRN